MKQEGKFLEDMRLKYEVVFDNDAGREVLAHMLHELYFFNPVETQEQRILSNYAKSLLGHIGKWVGGNKLQIVQKLMEIPNEREPDGEGKDEEAR